MESITLVEQIVKALDEKKGMDIKVLDIQAQTGIADYFVICNGTSAPHTKALSDFTEEKVEKELNEKILRREGYQGGSWILLDYGVVIVQIFKPEERSYYNLEKLWGDSPEVDTTGMIEE
jgi:ribosome-associated protein